MDDELFDTLEFPITLNYSPIVPFEVLGMSGPKQLVAVVDTGFTGFLQLPLSDGIAANLTLWGITPFKLADGREVKNLQCFGKIRFGDRELFGVITLSETGDQCLLGMQFLNSLLGSFTVSAKDKKAIFKLPKPNQNVTPSTTSVTEQKENKTKKVKTAK